MGRIDITTWTTVSPLLDQVLDLAPRDRGPFLARLRDARPEVAGVLEDLLEWHDAAEAANFLDAQAFEPDTGLAGTAVGAYVLERPLGSGGMGTVWLARRADGRFAGQAAVKFVNLAVLDRAGQERFRREGTALARLSHPNIARLLDAGVTQAGQPYLVIDYVDGERIDDYAARLRLDLAARLRLFLQVTDAVAHAHAVLVVHRDLKPSNILVDTAGQVKLLDFGVATFIEDDTGTRTISRLTAPGAGALTPECAAPEQVTGGPISTATDVYALGVLLYTLLTGQHPAGVGVRSPADLIKAIIDTEPPLLSSVLLDVRARRLLRGDLDTIVGKALKKNPAERYLSVTAMADDLRRHLRHEPIGARPDTVTYRAAKFVRRHRWPVAAALVAVAVLVGGLFVVDRQRRIAESRFRQLRHLSAQVFALDTRLYYLPGATQAREALVAMSLEYLAGLAADARFDPDLMHEVTDHYLRVARIQGVPTGPSLGDFAKAEESLKKADALVEARLASQPQDLRAVELSAAIRHDRMILADSERRDADAIVHATGAAERIEALLGDRRATREQRDAVIRLYSNVALATLNGRRYEDATRHAKRHLELVRSGEDPLYVSSLSVLANALRLQGHLDEALKAIREARALADQAPATDPRRTANRYGPLLREGFILGEDRAVSLERPAEAIAPLREAFEMHEARARDDPNDYTSRSRVGTSGRELGDILRWRDPREALAVYDVALGRLREIKDNVKARRDTALVLASSAYALRRLDRAPEAKRRIDEALTILAATKDYPADHIPFDAELYTVLLALADHHADEGQLAQAIDDYDALLAKVMRTGPDVENDMSDANDLSLVYEGLARLHRLTGAADQAAGLDAKRLALWQHWNRKLPNNPFVGRRLAPPQP